MAKTPKIAAIVMDDGEVIEGEKLEALRADPSKAKEYLDPTPIAPPVGYKAGPSLIDQMRAMVRNELSAQAAAEEFETFEDADDFEVDEDMDPYSPWEETFEPETQEPPRSGPAVQPGDPPAPPPPTPAPTPENSPAPSPAPANDPPK